jgi:hypothetical protein
VLKRVKPLHHSESHREVELEGKEERFLYIYISRKEK